MTGSTCAMAAAVAAAAIATGASASAATTWADPLGDVAGVRPAPDIASVDVAQTRERATLTIRFDPAGAPYSLSEADMYADVATLLLDIDRDGRQSEDDFLVVHAAATPGLAKLVLLGPPRSEPKRMWSLSASSSPSTLAFSLPKLALGNPSTIRFRVAVDRLFGEEKLRGGFDTCPDAGTYVARLTPVALRAIRLPAAALRPRAGRILSLSGVGGVTVTGKRVALTRVSAIARIRGRSLPPVERGAVSWRIPKSARGLTVVLRVTGRVGAAARTTSWHLRVV